MKKNSNKTIASFLKEKVDKINTCQTVIGTEGCEAGLINGLFEIDFRSSKLNCHAAIGVYIPGFNMIKKL